MNIYFVERENSESRNEWDEIFVDVWNFTTHEWIKVLKYIEGTRVSVSRPNEYCRQLVLKKRNIDYIENAFDIFFWPNSRNDKYIFEPGYLNFINGHGKVRKLED